MFVINIEIKRNKDLPRVKKKQKKNIQDNFGHILINNIVVEPSLFEGFGKSWLANYPETTIIFKKLI